MPPVSLQSALRLDELAMQMGIGSKEGLGGLDRPALTSFPTSLGRSKILTWAYPVIGILLLLLNFSGIGLGGEGAIRLASLAILLFGLPHGTLDLELIKQSRAGGVVPMPILFLLYLGLAGAMYLLWQAAPLLALCAFLIVATLHFAEDWSELDSPFLAHWLAVAILTAPALCHLAELENALVALSGTDEARVIAQAMLLLASVSLAIGVVAIVQLCRIGLRDDAAAAATTLTGMVLLPPVIGFALFFCIYHSPRHLRLSRAALGGPTRKSQVVVGLTGAAMGIAAALFALETRADLTSHAVAASFMTLSVLTVPHMVVPRLMARRPRRTR